MTEAEEYFLDLGVNFLILNQGKCSVLRVLKPMPVNLQVYFGKAVSL